MEYTRSGDAGTEQRQAFESALIRDISTASGLPEDNFHIKSLSPGSVVAEIEVRTKTAGGPDALWVVQDLKSQVSDPHSALRAGHLTKFAVFASILLPEVCKISHTFYVVVGVGRKTHLVLSPVSLLLEPCLCSPLSKVVLAVENGHDDKKSEKNFEDLAAIPIVAFTEAPTPLVAMAPTLANSSGQTSQNAIGDANNESYSTEYWATIFARRKHCAAVLTSWASLTVQSHLVNDKALDIVGRRFYRSQRRRAVCKVLRGWAEVADVARAEPGGQDGDKSSDEPPEALHASPRNGSLEKHVRNSGMHACDS